MPKCIDEKVSFGRIGRRVIVYAWANENTKRACESADDAYGAHRRMLDFGRPPSDWNQLLAEARAESQRLDRLVQAAQAPDPSICQTLWFAAEPFWNSVTALS